MKKDRQFNNDTSGLKWKGKQWKTYYRDNKKPGY